MSYRLYGRVVACDQPLGFHDCTVAADLWVMNGDVPPGITLMHDVPDPGGKGMMRVWDVAKRPVVEYDGWRFELSFEQVTYASIGPHDSPFDLVLERVVVPLVRLFHEPTCALHGASVVVENQAIVFVGPSGAGKSTTARLLAARGAFACDDLTLVDEKLCVHASAAGVRSFEKVGEKMGRELYPQSAKRWYAFPDPPPPAAPLGLIVYLDRGSSWKLQPLAGTAAVVKLLANTFDLEHPPTGFRTDRLTRVSEIARRVPLVELVYPANEGAPAHVDALWSRIRPLIASTV
jgi:hypothetical protein